jgi:hypothetical protein
MFTDESGNQYYYNAELALTQWEIPLDDEDRPPSTDEEVELPEGWERFFDNNVGQWYYYNAVTQESKWTLD